MEKREVRVIIKPEELWNHCQENKITLRDNMHVVAKTGDGDEDIRLFVTVSCWDEENDFTDYLFSVEDSESIIDRDRFDDPLLCKRMAAGYIFMMENMN